MEIVFACIAATQSTFTGTLSGDSNVPGYSVLNLDLDTVEGPAVIAPSVVGYVNSLEGMPQHFSCLGFSETAHLTERKLSAYFDRSFSFAV